MLKKYQHISFDLDGTLVHTLPEYRYKIVPQVVERLKGRIKDNRQIDRFWFEGSRDEIVVKEFGLDLYEFWGLFRQIDTPQDRAAHTASYPDSEDALKKIKSLGKKISIITGAPHLVAEIEIKKLNDVRLDFYQSIYDSGFPPKPAPEAFRHVMEKLKVRPQDTVYIGNSDEDAHFAKNAGVDFIYLERKQHEFDSRDWAVKIIHSLEELF